MRRRSVIRNGAIALVAGGAANILVAWALVVTSDLAGGGTDVSYPDGLPDAWVTWLDPPPPIRVVNTSGRRYGGVGWRCTLFGIAEPPGALQIVEAGWPMIAFEGRARTVLDYSGPVGRAEIVESSGAIPCNVDRVPLFDFAGRTLPVAPRWPGLLVDTSAWSVVAWLVVFGPGQVRRSRRIRRGQCPRCRYPMGASTVCTECGGALPARRGG